MVRQEVKIRNGVFRKDRPLAAPGHPVCHPGRIWRYAFAGAFFSLLIETQLMTGSPVTIYRRITCP